MTIGSESAATTQGGSLTITSAVLDAILTAQLGVALAGEAGDPPSLKWWRTDLASEFGSEDLLRQLLPHTWRWAVLDRVAHTAGGDDPHRARPAQARRTWGRER